MTNVAVIGAGLIGRAWSIVFARSGFNVTLWDQFPQQTALALTFIADRLPELRTAGLLADEPETVLSRIHPMQSLWEAVRGAEYIQESGPERTDVKLPLFTELERAAQPDAIIASSSSGIPASAFTEHLKTRHRCLIAHPVNPPYLVPLVEICPAPWTDPVREDAGADAADGLGHRAGGPPARRPPRGAAGQHAARPPGVAGPEANGASGTQGQAAAVGIGAISRPPLTKI
jgi:L-gulonate 3-dehydrogenase